MPPPQPSPGPNVDPAWWIDRVVEAMDAPPPVPMPVAETVLRSYDSISRPAAVMCDDGRTYIIKAPHRNPGDHVRTRSIFTDQIVGRLGALMGAPVAEVSLVELPELLVRYDPALKHFVHGPAHACLEIPGVRDGRGVEYIDVNRTRFADLAVLYGWFESFDEQFLYTMAAPQLVYSADHGHFLPGRDQWTRITLRRELRSASPNASMIGECRFTKEQLVSAVAKLSGINDADIVRAVSAPPLGWGIPVADRMEVGVFLSRRRIELLRAFQMEA